MNFKNLERQKKCIYIGRYKDMKIGRQKEIYKCLRKLKHKIFQQNQTKMICQKCNFSIYSYSYNKGVTMRAIFSNHAG